MDAQLAAPGAAARQRQDPAPGRAPEELRRVTIENIRPSVDGGRFPIKRTPGERVDVRADVYADGHEQLRVVLLDRPRGSSDSAFSERKNAVGWRETEMDQPQPGLDEWTASFEVSDIGWHEYAVGGWVDRFDSWRHGIELKAAAGQNVEVELLEGALLVRDAAGRVPEEDGDRATLLERADALSDATAA